MVVVCLLILALRLSMLLLVTAFLEELTLFAMVLTLVQIKSNLKCPFFLKLCPSGLLALSIRTTTFSLDPPIIIPVRPFFSCGHLSPTVTSF